MLAYCNQFGQSVDLLSSTISGSGFARIVARWIRTQRYRWKLQRFAEILRGAFKHESKLGSVELPNSQTSRESLCLGQYICHYILSCIMINYCEYEQGRPPMPDRDTFPRPPILPQLALHEYTVTQWNAVMFGWERRSEGIWDFRRSSQIACRSPADRLQIACRSPADRVVFLACWGLRPTCCYVAHSSGILRGFLVLWSTLGHTPGWRWTHGRSPPSKPTLNRRSTTGSVKKTCSLLKLRVNILKPLLSKSFFFCFPLDWW